MKKIFLCFLFFINMKICNAEYNNPDTIKVSTSKNGITVVTDTIKDIESVTVQICFKIGSRYETKELNGISHFLEHMAFKGTTKRTAQQITDEIAAVGGVTNAMTSKEYTCYFIKVLKKDIEMVFDILSDIILNSTFDSKEIEKERGVILQEMAMYEDNPRAVTFEETDLQSYGNSKLGQKIIGTSKNIKKFNRNDFVKFKEDNYTTKNALIAAVGNITNEEALNLTNKYFSSLTTKEPILTKDAAKYVGGKIIKTKPNLQQVQFVLSFKSPTKKENLKDSYAMKIASFILGGGMSSRLFQEIREKNGLVYHISSNTEEYSDIGEFAIYAATSKKDVNKMSELILSEIEKFKTNGISNQELSRAINTVEASILMKLESPSSRLGKLVDNYLMEERYITKEEIMNNIRSITEEDVLKAFTNTVDIKNATLVVYGSDLEENTTCKKLYDTIKFDIKN